jgi:hypothetical protein
MKTILNSLGDPLKEVVLGHDGKPMILNRREQYSASILQKQWDQTVKNALGADVNITTLTTVLKKVSEQKFYKIPFADYVPVKVGEGAYSDFLLTYRSYSVTDDFASGIINTGANQARLAAADTAVDSVSVNVYDWAKEISWSITDLAKAAKAGNWDLITAKEKSRKTSWDLGLQKVAFLGIPGNSNILGLFNQPGVTVDTATLTAPINSLVSNTTQLSAFVAAVLNVYRANCNRTAWPTHFVIPESDYLGLATPSSPNYPILSLFDLLQNTFKSMTGNKDFKILPCAYGDEAFNGASTQYYALYNANEDSIRMNIPVDYTNTLANSLNNYQFLNVAYGEFTGVLAIRPAELYYFQLPN